MRVTETGSTNTDMLAMAARGEAREGDWLVAERQTAGRGRQGRAWVSPPGNLYASGLVELRPGDPPAPTLAMVAGVAVHQVIVGPNLIRAKAVLPAMSGQRQPGPGSGPGRRDGDLHLKWPNDLLAGDAKLAGILLERRDSAVVVGVGMNLAHHPDMPKRPTTSLADLDVVLTPKTAAVELSVNFAHWLDVWRFSLTDVRSAWLARAHPHGTPLSAVLPDGQLLSGRFDGLTDDCALRLRLASGETRVIHAGDVFVI